MKSSLAFLKQHVLPAAICFGAALALTRTALMQRVENVTLDERTRLRALRQSPPDPRWVVVGIDDESIQQDKFGRWPWPRQVHGQILYWLAKEKPAVVAWDILFTLPDTAEPMNDQALIAGTKAAADSAVIFGANATDVETPFIRPPHTPPFPNATVIGERSAIPDARYAAEPLPELLQSARVGFVDTPPSVDGVRRVVPLLMRIGGDVYPSLALESVLAFWKVPAGRVKIVLGDAIYLPTADGQRRIPIDGSGGYFVNYRWSRTTARNISYVNLAEYLQAKNTDPTVAIHGAPDLAHKVLVVGQMAVGLTDNGPSPFDSESPLVLVHANVIDNILRADFARIAPPWLVWGAAFMATLLGTEYFAENKFRHHVVFALGTPVVYFGGATLAWMALNLALPVAAPLTAFAAVQFVALGRRVLAEQRAKAEIKGMFASYVSPTVVDRIVESGSKPQLGGHKAEITAYFSDIERFSTFSEMMPPEKLVDLLNEYLTACTDILQEEGGTLDKYIGDAMVGMFGAPIAMPDHAYRACVVSQRVQLKLEELRAKWRSEGDRWPQIVGEMRSRIGLNTGRCVIGNMGSRTRFDYTMMGDDVNLAARMESGAKTFGVYSMCTESTKLACEQHGGDRFVFRSLGSIVVKGRSQPVPIFELVGFKDQLTATTRDCAAEFEEGLRRYFARDWPAALARFRRSAELEPNRPGVTFGITTNPSRFFLAQSEAYALESPPDSWDGVYRMKEK